MPQGYRKGDARPKAARAPVVACCEACGGPMSERKGKHACSARCRAELSRRRRHEALAARDQEIRGLLAAALRTLEEGPP
jgi:hypothetical protein